MSYRKEDYIYVGIDLHKETHTAVFRLLKYETWRDYFCKYSGGVSKIG